MSIPVGSRADRESKKPCYSLAAAPAVVIVVRNAQEENAGRKWEKGSSKTKTQGRQNKNSQLSSNNYIHTQASYGILSHYFRLITISPNEIPPIFKSEKQQQKNMTNKLKKPGFNLIYSRGIEIWSPREISKQKNKNFQNHRKTKRQKRKEALKSIVGSSSLADWN
jgi:hypothetical protein